MNEPALLDANLLVYAFYPKAPQYRVAHHVLQQAQDAQAALYVSSQVLAEFYAMVTNPKRVTPALKFKSALQKIHEIRSLPGLAVLPLPVDVVDRWVALIGRVPPACG
jgi:predicted nucleic acid-binding protein